MGIISVMGLKGDTKIIWSSDNPDEIANARRSFNELKGKGFLAYSVEGKEGKKGTVIQEFDEKAERIIMAPRMVGG